MDITDLADDSQPPKPQKKTALEKMREDMQRQLVPLRRIQEMEDQVRRYAPEYQARELFKQFEVERQLQETLARTIPKQVQEMLDGTFIAAQAQRMLEQYFPRNLQAQHAEILRTATGLNSISELAKAYEKSFAPVAVHQEWIERLQHQALGGLSVQDLARQIEQVNPTFAAMEVAKKSLDALWGHFRDIDFIAYEADGEATREAEAAAKSITQAASGEPTLKEAVDQIIAAIQAQQKPTVQLMLFLFFRKMLEWLISGAIGAVMGHYASQVLGESPQAASKAVKEVAREAGARKLFAEYRYISAKVLIVRQNPRALSPELARITFGKVVKLVKKDKGFALILWTDEESGAEIQGWVFSRYLGNFN